MSRLSKRAWYERVNAAWGEGPIPRPALTAQEAVSAFKRLYRFVHGRKYDGKIVVTSGNRYTWRRYRVVGKGPDRRFVPVMLVNPDKGWHNLIHDLSHLWVRGAHGAEHARMERRLIREVVRRGWLAGKLKREPKVVPPRDLVAERRKRLEARIKRWEAKQRRAVGALRRLRRSMRYYLRQAV